VSSDRRIAFLKNQRITLMLKRYLPFLFLLPLLLIGCAKQTHKVVYEVGGTAGEIALSYRNASNALEELNVTSPWVLEFEAESYQRVVINARNATNSGDISCKITVDGKELSAGRSEGAFKLVRCEGLLVPPTPTPGAGS